MYADKSQNISVKTLVHIDDFRLKYKDGIRNKYFKGQNDLINALFCRFYLVIYFRLS